MDRQSRLRTNDDFQRVRREGRSWATTWVVLLAAANGLDYARFGFAIGKRLGKAVVRNRVKRRLREVVRARQAQVAPGWDLVFVAREGVAATSFEQLDRAVLQLLQRAGLLRGARGDGSREERGARPD